MNVWILMFLTSLLVPGIMFGAGHWFLKKPPKTINCLCGYRTTRSMKNQDTWDFAHRKCGEVWLRLSKWVALPSVIAMLAVLGQSEDTIGTVGTAVILVQVIPLLASIVPVEKALRKTFDEDGSPRK